MQVSPASGSKDRVARCLLECPEKFKTSKPSTFPPLLLDAPTLPSFARLLLLDFRLLSARPPSSLFFSFFFFLRLSSKNRATPVLSSEPPDGKSRSPADRSRNNQFYDDRFRPSRRYPR